MHAIIVISSGTVNRKAVKLILYKPPLPPRVSLGLCVLGLESNLHTWVYGNFAGKFSEVARAGRNHLRGQSTWGESTSCGAAVDGRFKPTSIDGCTNE